MTRSGRQPGKPTFDDLGGRSAPSALFLVLCLVATSVSVAAWMRKGFHWENAASLLFAFHASLQLASFQAMKDWRAGRAPQRFYAIDLIAGPGLVATLLGLVAANGWPRDAVGNLFALLLTWLGLMAPAMRPALHRRSEAARRKLEEVFE